MDHDTEQRVRESFGRQALMATLGARLSHVGRGEVTVELPYRADLTQQHGFVHAGIVTTIADTACGYAALSRMPPSADVLSVEFKVNLLSPAVGDQLVARAKVLKAGRTLTVCWAEVWAEQGAEQKLVATMLATMIRREAPDLAR